MGTINKLKSLYAYNRHICDSKKHNPNPELSR